MGVGIVTKRRKRKASRQCHPSVKEIPLFLDEAIPQNTENKLEECSKSDIEEFRVALIDQESEDNAMRHNHDTEPLPDKIGRVDTNGYVRLKECRHGRIRKLGLGLCGASFIYLVRLRFVHGFPVVISEV
jgi:hypothetical protein